MSTPADQLPPTATLVTEGEPYPGLRPYREDEKDNFFGREADCKILIDKILVHRLTLLFAATGVGKSSLLQAAVLPQLKAPHGENLDVAYYIDWVSNPLEGLRNKVREDLQASGSWRPEITYAPAPNEKLEDFFGFCALFTRQPLIVVLDQFEEFFRYQKGRQHFEPFLEQLTGVITSQSLPVHLVFSMREDFALELDAFKKYLPLSVFDNLYRLDKLGKAAAREAILAPLKPTGFRFESELLEQLLKDLLSRELRRDGNSPLADMTESVEPPYLQIVCSRLWELEKNNPKKLIRLQTYENAGRSTGLVETHIQQSMKSFSEEEKDIASRAFDRLISPHGAKIPYTAEDLSTIIFISKESLDKVLDKLVSLRILRTQKRKDHIWYELYHDMFSQSITSWSQKLKEYDLDDPPKIHVDKCLAKFEIKETAIASRVFENLAIDSEINLIYSAETLATITNVSEKEIKEILEKLVQLKILRSRKTTEHTFYELYHKKLTKSIIEWNNHTKEKLLRRKVITIISNTIALSLVAYCGTIFYINATNHTFKLGKQEDSWVETYQGKQGWPDPFDQHQYIKENPLQYYQLEPHKRFERRPVLEYREEHQELISNLPLDKVILADVNNGYYSKALELMLGSIASSRNTQSARSAIRAITDMQTKRGLEMLQLIAAKDNQPTHILEEIFRTFVTYRMRLPNNLEQETESILFALKQSDLEITFTKDPRLIKPLLQFLKDDSNEVRNRAAQALGSIGDSRTIEPLIQLLEDESNDVRGSAALALGNIGDSRTIEPLIQLLKDENNDVRSNAAQALGNIGDNRAVDALTQQLINDNSNDVRASATQALGIIGDNRAVDTLTQQLLKDDSNDVRKSAAQALGIIGDNRASAPLVQQLLNDDNIGVRSSAAQALGNIGDSQIVALLIQLLNDKSNDVRSSAAQALGIVGDTQTIGPLIQQLNDENNDVRSSAAQALGNIGDTQTIEPLIQRLGDDSNDVRSSAAQALGSIGDNRVVVLLADHLRNDDSNIVRSSAAQALGNISDDRSIEALTQQLLNDDNATVRKNAAQALGSIGDSRVIEPLTQQLLNDDNEYVRRSAALSLNNVETPLSPKFRPISNTKLQKASEEAPRQSKSQTRPILDLLADTSLKWPKRLDALKRFAQNEDQTLVKKQLLTIATEQEDNFGNLAYRLLGNLRAADALSLLEKRLVELDTQLKEWRKLRDGEKDDFTNKERDEFLEKMLEEKAKIKTRFAYDYGYAITRIDPKRGLELLAHNLADVRKGAYMGFAMEANIKWLQKLDTEREQRRESDPIFRQATFRAIDLGLRRLEVLGNHDNGDQELKELEAWRAAIANQPSRTIPKVDPDDEVLERLDWTIMMMKQYKQWEKEFPEKYGWERVWPEDMLPVNQPYPKQQ